MFPRHPGGRYAGQRCYGPYVAKLLGDTADTIEKHYVPFVKELRERARQLMENREGIEKPDRTSIAQQTRPREAGSNENA